MLRVHPVGLAVFGLGAGGFVQPGVARRVPVDPGAGAAVHDTRRTPSQPPMASASSAMRLSGSVLPPRTCSSAVISRRAPMSTMRSFSDLAEKPPKTTEWIAPIRLQACMATMASTDMGR